jgi:hypothetical protein
MVENQAQLFDLIQKLKLGYPVVSGARWIYEALDLPSDLVGIDHALPDIP